MASFKIKRIYEEPSGDDGYRVLVDRLWPRGVRKEVAQLDEWAKDLAPSSALRKWFDHQSDRFDEFAAIYQDELAENPAVSLFLKSTAKQPVVTLLYGAKDPKINHAIVLQGFLEDTLDN